MNINPLTFLQRTLGRTFLAGLAVVFITSQAAAAPATRVSGAIWAGGELFDTVLTDTSFSNPPAQSTDIIYNFAMSGLIGQRSVSEAAPGDREFNGGRWSVKLVVFTPVGMAVHDPDADGVVNFELTSGEEVIVHALLGHIEIIDTTIYFECPLLPRRAR